MDSRRIGPIVGWALLSCSVTLFAQEGHPLKGTWMGDWGPNPDHRNQVTIVMDWDGSTITGIVNPGPGSLEFTTAELDTSDWSVHIEVDAMGREGVPIRYMIDGTLKDIGLPDRRLTGTWTHGETRGDFTITRQ